MAIRNCGECKKEVSTEAIACPNCGAKQPKKTSRTTWLIAGLFAFAAGTGVVSQVQRNSEKEATLAAAQSIESKRIAALTPALKLAEEEKKKAAEKATKEENEKFATRATFALVGAKQLKASAKDPATFEFQSIYLAKDGSACYEYRAKNSFGAILPSSAFMNLAGKIFVKERDGNKFVNAWNKSCTNGGSELRPYFKQQGMLD
jgi:predicted  nucleic acid-binding Zn-ribbon protein